MGGTDEFLQKEGNSESGTYHRVATGNAKRVHAPNGTLNGFFENNVKAMFGELDQISRSTMMTPVQVYTGNVVSH